MSGFRIASAAVLEWRLNLAASVIGILWLVTIPGIASAQTSDIKVRITPLVSGVDASFRGLAVLDSREAWVSGSNGTVIRTTNAGQTWQRVPIPEASELDFRDIEVLDAETILLMSAGEGKASKVLRSDDAGSTWKAVLENSEAEGFFDGMAFDADGRKGFLFGDPVGGRLEVYQTSDGGITWQRLPERQRPVLREGEYGFAASGTGVVVRGRNIWIATGGSVARVLRSSDGGVSWQSVETPVRHGNASSGIFSIDFEDETTAVAIGGDYVEPQLERNNVAVTSDGGKTWRSIPDVIMPHKACVRAIGGGHWIACGRTGIAVSSNAGVSWTPVSSESYYTLDVDRATGTGFLAGKDGAVARFERMLDRKP